MSQSSWQSVGGLLIIAVITAHSGRITAEDVVVKNQTPTNYTGNEGKAEYRHKDVEYTHLYVHANILEDGQPKQSVKTILMLKCALEEEGESLLIQFPESISDGNGFVSAKIARDEVNFLIDENFDFSMCKVLARISDHQIEIETSTYTGTRPVYKYGLPMQIDIDAALFYPRRINDKPNCLFEGTTGIVGVIILKPNKDLTLEMYWDAFKRKEKTWVIPIRDSHQKGSCYYSSLRVDPSPESLNKQLDAKQLQAKCDTGKSECWHRKISFPQELTRYNQNTKKPTPEKDQWWIYKNPDSDIFVYHHVQ